MVGFGKGSQTLFVHPLLFDLRSTMHELFHALGREHEHSRPDRDKYIRVNLSNVQPGKHTNLSSLYIYM